MDFRLAFEDLPGTRGVKLWHLHARKRHGMEFCVLSVPEGRIIPPGHIDRQ